jgi:transposase-like protein
MIGENGNFEAVFIAPGGCIYAFRWLRPFVGLDGAITKSQFRMQLLIAVGIDANDEVLPLA